MDRKRPQHFLFPHGYFRARARGIAPVPVYFFHQIDPAGFGAMCAALASSGVRTLTFNELLDGVGVIGPAVVITLDDGWSSAWSLALPIARRYGVRLTLFATPATFHDTAERRSYLADGVRVEDLVARDRGEQPLLTWGELAGLHESGVVEVQSHSLSHSVVCISDRLKGWVGAARQSWQSGNIPLLRRIAGADVPVMRPERGAPLSDVGRALVEDRRYIVDESFETDCIACAASGRAVPLEPGDRMPGRWETEPEREQRFFADLDGSRRMLQQRLPGCQVRVLAPPWAMMHPALPRIATQAGYEAIALGYPADTGSIDSALSITPRLYGEGLWTLIHGPVFGAPRWLATRRRNIARRAAGAVP